MREVTLHLSTAHTLGCLVAGGAVLPLVSGRGLWVLPSMRTRAGARATVTGLPRAWTPGSARGPERYDGAAMDAMRYALRLPLSGLLYFETCELFIASSPRVQEATRMIIDGAGISLVSTWTVGGDYARAHHAHMPCPETAQ